MKKALHMSLVLVLGVALVSSAAYARKGMGGRDSYTRAESGTQVWGLDNVSVDHVGDQPLHASAAATTVILNSSKFDGATCTNNGWTTVDVSAPVRDYWHVDAFTTAPWANTKDGHGIVFDPVQGSRSMWLAAVPPTGLDPILCSYVDLPGYGTGWNYAFCSVACVSKAGGPSPDLDVAFKMKFDTETSYDGTVLEYTTDCSGNSGWALLDEGHDFDKGWSSHDSISVAKSYVVPAAASYKIRWHFTSDTGASNEDGGYFGFGVALDSLSFEGSAVEGFETTAIGAHGNANWTSCNTPGFGNVLGLFKKAQANYEDPCVDDLGCYWAAIVGSTEFFTCGTPPQPGQKVVPHGNTRGDYVNSEIWSPVMNITGSTGSEFHFQNALYQDMPLDNLIFWDWWVHTGDNTGCPGAWKNDNTVYYSTQKLWLVNDINLSAYVNTNTGVQIQVKWGVLDQCPFWCGTVGSGVCHGPAPYFDTAKIYRVTNFGPQWQARVFDAYQDNFAADGSITGKARIDEAIDTFAYTDVNRYAPGDSAIIYYLIDPHYSNPVSLIVSARSGLSNDTSGIPGTGRHPVKNAAYGYFTVTPFTTTKISAAISDNPRWPYIGTISAGGKTWAQVRMDYTYQGSATVAGDGHNQSISPNPFVTDRFNVDVNDNLFTPGDTIEFFFGATSPDGTTYFSDAFGATGSLSDIAANPAEVTILPAGGFNRGGDILYVDQNDQRGTQPYWDGAFLALGLANKIDRFDVEAPGSGLANHLALRVYDIQRQLNNCYRKIIYDCGNNTTTLGDGSGTPEKSDDYTMIDTFLGNLTNNGGVMIMGDNVPSQLAAYGGAGAVAFISTYMPFTLVTGNHRLTPTFYSISPTVVPASGTLDYTDSFTIFGGCPGLNDFDVMTTSGSSKEQLAYNTAGNTNGALLSNVNGFAHVLLGGFSLTYARDNELNGISDRAQFVHDSIIFLGNQLGSITNAGPTPKVTSLAQNYPNPFNPQTTIAFTLKDRGGVSLKVYSVNGELVRTLVNENRAANSYKVTWDGRNDAGSTVSSGVYFYKLVTNNFSQTKKMVLLK